VHIELVSDLTSQASIAASKGSWLEEENVQNCFRERRASNSGKNVKQSNPQRVAKITQDSSINVEILES
ncbi:hypothetical protein TNCV_869181, partial [Trichonephila clavipes]